MRWGHERPPADCVVRHVCTGAMWAPWWYGASVLRPLVSNCAGPGLRPGQAALFRCRRGSTGRCEVAINHGFWPHQHWLVVGDPTLTHLHPVPVQQGRSGHGISTGTGTLRCTLHHGGEFQRGERGSRNDQLRMHLCTGLSGGLLQLRGVRHPRRPSLLQSSSFPSHSSLPLPLPLPQPKAPRTQ